MGIWPPQKVSFPTPRFQLSGTFSLWLACLEWWSLISPTMLPSAATPAKPFLFMMPKYGDRRNVPRFFSPYGNLAAPKSQLPHSQLSAFWYVFPMARLPRVVVVDLPHHVTQRGNARQTVFVHDADRLVYLELLRQYSDLYSLALLGYCLMSNHVHLIAVPGSSAALAKTLKHTHG